MKPIAALLLCCPLAAAEGTLRQPLPVTDDLTLVVSLAPALRSGSIDGVDDGVLPAYDLRLDGTSDLGPGATLRWTRGWWDGDGWGWLAGIEGSVIAAAGELEPEAGGSRQDLDIAVAAAGPVAGIGWRADIQSLELPGDALETHLLIHLKAGGGTATIDDAGSGAGVAFGAGATWGAWWTGWHRWKVGVEVGYEWLRLQDVAWDNTDDSSFTFSGLVAGAGVGWRF